MSSFYNDHQVTLHKAFRLKSDIPISLGGPPGGYNL